VLYEKTNTKRLRNFAKSFLISFFANECFSLLFLKSFTFYFWQATLCDSNFILQTLEKNEENYYFPKLIWTTHDLSLGNQNVAVFKMYGGPHSGKKKLSHTGKSNFKLLFPLNWFEQQMIYI